MADTSDPDVNRETSPEAKKAEKTYYPVELDYLKIDSICEKDLFLLVGSKHVLYRNADIPFTVADRDRLIANKQQLLYIQCDSERGYHKFLEKNLSTIIEKKSIPVEKKATVLYQCACSLVEEVFEEPRSGENIQRSEDMVQNSIRFLQTGTDAFLKLISLSSHDYYTFTHSVNVMAFSMALAEELEIKSEKELLEIGLGAILHDVGKSRIQLKILNKPGALDPAEWGEMRKHPQHGHDLVSDSPHVGEVPADIILHHHEKLNGTGYPDRLCGNRIGIPAQIVGICDIYDALTTSRTYRAARKPFNSFQIMQVEMHDQVNQDYVRKLIQFLNLKNR